MSLVSFKGVLHNSEAKDLPKELKDLLKLKKRVEVAEIEFLEEIETFKETEISQPAKLKKKRKK